MIPCASRIRVFRPQHAVAVCLDFYGNDMAFAVGISKEGNCAIELACQAELCVLLSSSAVVGVIERKVSRFGAQTTHPQIAPTLLLTRLGCMSGQWRGPWLQALLSRKLVDRSEIVQWSWNALTLVVVILYNLFVLLPLTAFLHPIIPGLLTEPSRKTQPPGSLMQTAFFQAVCACISNCDASLMASMGPTQC